MRFLFGLLTGAVLTLLVATAMDAPTSLVVNGVRDLAADAWKSLIARTSDSLFEAPEVTGGREVLTAASREPAGEPGSATADEASLQPEIDGMDPALAEPAPALPPPASIDEMPPSGYWAERARTLEDVMQTATALHTSGASPVWSPFHSQMSAEGFATRLSQALDRDFRVERQAPGAYQVVFDAAGPSDRDLVLERVSEITGQ